MASIVAPNLDLIEATEVSPDYVYAPKAESCEPDATVHTSHSIPMMAILHEITEPRQLLAVVRTC
jgi:hypothetical protein